ncbi:MAG TPA: carboxypeptidase-like regulatory domain-containing protein [Prolixibacteraceae bacterium]|nr:carboxypeptidase-like regulatory domain-containing protein [Prolixibacteraceae bacterium]
MQLCKFSIIWAILLFSLNLSGQQQDGSVLERRVSINAENLPIHSILEQVSWQTRVYFSYDASQVNTEKTHTLQIIEKSLYYVLHELFNEKEYKLTELENQIIITKRDSFPTGLQVVKNDTAEVKYFFLSAKIIDDKKQEPISYASVSVFNKPIGTISNSDGDFLLKLHPKSIRDTVVVSCMGYAQIVMPAYQLLDEEIIAMKPISVKIREVKVTSTTPEKLLTNIRENIKNNYTDNTRLMAAFYRETVKQDANYINVSEAVLEILKSPYVNTFRNDLVRLVKGRQSADVQPFTWLNFKLQGGPYTITKLDVVKTVETFIDEEFQETYKYSISDVIWYNENPVYILEFQPLSNTGFANYTGEIYVHRETFAIVRVRFKLNRKGLKQAAGIMIKRKPAGVKAKPSYVQYEVDYQSYQGKWHLKTAKASVKFKIKSRRERLNSEFHSISELLITDIKPTGVKRFSRQETFSQRDVFVEMISNYDPAFWENYNIIKPDEDLRNAFKHLSSAE